jgi:hypothetical protein
MHRIKLGPSTFFKLFIAAATLVLGLAAASLWPRQSAQQPAPPVAVAPARAEVSVRDTSENEPPDAARRFEHSYDNDTYGFSIRLPAGVVGAGSTPPAPDHGFGIDLDHPGSTAWNGRPDFPKSYLYVDGSYNSLEWERLDEAADSHLSFLREKGRNVRVRSRKDTLLDDVPALRIVALYEEDGVEMVSDAVFAFRLDEDGEVSVVYTLALSTPLSKYERDRPVFEAVWEGCHLHLRC